MNDRPSGAIAIPSSSVGPDVTCSGLPSGNRWRQTWNVPPSDELRYIHFPSIDHAADRQAARAGPTARPGEVPSIGTRRQGRNTPTESISTSKTHFPSGEG